MHQPACAIHALGVNTLAKSEERLDGSRLMIAPPNTAAAIEQHRTQHPGTSPKAVGPAAIPTAS